MKDDFESVPSREKLLNWSRTAADWRQLRSKVDHGGLGTSESNPAELPAGAAQQSAVARCEWALQQLARERQNIAAAQSEQARGGTLREQLSKLQSEKQAKERARSRKLMFRFGIAATVPLAIAVLVGARLWQNRPPRVSRASVEQSVTRALASRGLTLASVSFVVGALQGSTAPVNATFKARLDQPLFTLVESQPYLQQNYRLDPAVSQEIYRLSNGKDGRRTLELAGLTGASFDVARVALLKTATPAGTTYDGTAMLRASRASGWQVADAFINLPALRTDAKPRTAYPGSVIELDRADDQARLRALVDDQPKMLARLRQAHDAVMAEILAQHKTEETSLVGFFRAGTIFTGTVAGRTPAETKKIHLEVTESAGGSGTHAIKLLAHNDGGWGDGRVFEGTWNFDTARDHFVVSLASRSDQAVANAGPVLGDVKLLKLELSLEDGRLTGGLDGNAAQFTRVADGEEDKFRRTASPDYFAMLDALVLGLYYLGSVPVAPDNTQQILLRFTGGGNGGAAVTAVLQDPDREAWQYQLTGPLVGNRYRETTWPLRLAVVRTAIPPGIPAKSSVVQFPALALRVENGKLIGDFRNRPFSFELLSREEAARRAQTTTAWRRAFDARLQPGGVLTGILVNPDNSIKSAAVLRVLTVNAAAGTLEARLEPERDPATFRNLTGKLFPDAGTVSLDFDVRPNQYRVDPRAPEPFFKSGRDSLVLAVEGMALTGHDGYNWSFTFRLDQAGR